MNTTEQIFQASSSPLASIDSALRSLFPTQAEETLIQKARYTLGISAKDLADEELETFLTEFQHLIDYWLDTFEQQLFDGMTLQQVLRKG